MRTRGIEYVITLLFLTLLLAAVCPGVKACETCNAANGWLVDDGTQFGLPKVENPSNPAGQGPFSARISGGTWYKQSEKSTWTVCTGATMEFNVTAIDYDFCDCGNEWIADDPVYYLWKRSDVEVQEGTSNTYTYTFNSTGTYTIKVGGDGYSHENPSRGCYRYDGYASLYTTPITINVVEISSVTISAPSEGSKATFNSATPGEKTITCTATADPSSATELITWTCEDITGTQKIWSPDPPVGGSVTLTLRGLPSNNQYFGDTWVKASACSAEDTNTFKLFFTATATNHPGGVTPNWYYYWTQALNNGPHNYDASVDYGVTRNEWGNAVIYIGANAYVTDGTLPRHPGVNYINAFGFIVSHEKWHQSHRTHNLNVHGGWDPSAAEDVDDDAVCDREPGDPPGHNGGWESQYGTDPNDQTTYGETIDREWIAQQQETNPNADSIDWANEGSQYHP